MDLCLLKFNENILSAGTGTAKVCLSDSYPEGGKACWIAGWGLIEDGGTAASDQLKSVGVNILSQSYCLQNTIHNFLFADDICVGSPDTTGNNLIDGGIGACQGDSGGPLVCDVNGAATLMGVTSRGNVCGGEGQPSLYTSISTDDWISTTIAANP
ncbi:Oidioi.mRNA.OKI2018_I69.chr2.g4023.t1.cds [Oikopleura dioica]|uniref:Oidioi.mRNA.OKI2018_I69.chr2.g4023.t1.cds n=1 Tax=Oikopleura dioica TaxID=34765 RepID=A0ABN7SVN6_OIKDI|nr:Oidioi.mRNA.OKI2018_I69.chr2.g4023.t1.cds [Oikopleura dioica]